MNDYSSKHQQSADEFKTREHQREEERTKLNTSKSKKKKIMILTIFLVVSLMGAGIFLLKSSNSGPGEFDSLAECITNSGTIMYGTDWCPHCANQKASFGKSFRLINYVNCDKDKIKCDAADVKGYPTWTFSDGSVVSGEQTLETLAKMSNCEFSNETK
ncbi:MAG: hypothetical protein AABW49_03220 [Nanoarchaeota archaeon]